MERLILSHLILVSFFVLCIPGREKESSDIANEPSEINHLQIYERPESRSEVLAAEQTFMQFASNPQRFLIREILSALPVTT